MLGPLVYRIGRSVPLGLGGACEIVEDGDEVFGHLLPIIAPKIGANGPEIVTLCAILLPVPSGVTSQLNVNVVIGLPRLVVILPFVPSAIGPSTCADEMPEFQRLQLFGSRQTLQTFSGDAVVERETP